MNKSFRIFLFILIISFLFFPLVKASCVVQGYTFNITGDVNKANVTGTCEDSAETISDISASDGFYYLSFGGPADSCSSRCDNVFINGTNSTYSITGNPDDGYPMNSTTTAGWGTIAAHTSNITMLESVVPIPYFGTNPADNNVTPIKTPTFDAKCTDNSGLSSLKIYGNWSGWGAKITQATPTNDTWYNLTSASISDGTYVWTVYCNDTSGNEAFNSTNRTITIDSTAPTITIQSPSGYYNRVDIWFNATTNEQADWCGISINGDPNITLTNSTGNWNNLNDPTAEGTDTVIFFCNDTVGNMGSASRTFYVDLTNPTAYFGTNPVDNYNSSSSSITFDGKCTDNIALSSLQIWTNKTGTWQSDSSQATPTNDTWYNKTITGWTSGAYKWAVYCIDQATNFDFTDTNRTLIVNTTPNQAPYIYTNNPTNGSTSTSNTVTFNMMCSDDYEIAYGLIYGNWSGGWHINQTNSSLINATWWNPSIYLPDGAYIWSAWCNDTGGLTNASGNISFIVEYSAPGGGGGGGGGGLCSGTCYIGTTCPRGSSNLSGSCASGQICCSTSYCPYAKKFIDQYSMLGFSAFDFQTFCTVNPDLNQTKLKDTINNYVTKCGTYCWFFTLPYVGKYFEMVGRAISKTYACLAFIILLLVIIIIIIYLYYRNKKKRKRRR